MSQDTKTLSLELPIAHYEAIKNLKLGLDMYSDPCVHVADNESFDLALLENKGYIFQSEEAPGLIYYLTYFTWLIREAIYKELTQINPLDNQQKR